MTRGIAAALALACLAWPTASAVAGPRGAIVVRVRPGVDASALRDDLAARGLTLGARIPHTRLFPARARGRTQADAVRVARADPRIAAAQPDHVLHAFDVPNDPFFGSAESYLSTIRLPQAWDLSHGSAGVVVAVVDTGVSAVGDLATQVLPGRNFVGGTDPRDDSVIGHGTLVAGVAAATTNNALGIAGAAWNASVLPVKVLDSHGYGTDSQVAAGVVWAADHGADVINLSLGGPTAAGDALCDATTYAQTQGALVVASAGNGANAWLNYPAACPGVVAVTATDAQGNFASFSSFGPDIGIAAPGIAITSTRNDNRFGTESGTSLSAPIVSGAAALVIATHPEWSAAQVAERLEDTAQDRGPPGVDPYYGHGLLDAYAALGGPRQPPAVPVRDVLEPNNDPSHATPLHKAAKATIVPEGDVDWYVTSLRRPARLRIDVVAPPYDSRTGPNLRPVVQLLDADGNALATNAPDAQTARISARLPAGLYYVRVTNGCGARSAGTYRVSLAETRVTGVISRAMP